MAKFNSKSTKPEIESVEEDQDQTPAKPTLKELFAKVGPAEEEVKDSMELLEEKRKDLSDVLQQVSELYGKGPYKFEGEIVTVVGRKHAEGMTYFLKGRSKQQQDVQEV